jgi:hypothetical protein
MLVSSSALSLPTPTKHRVPQTARFSGGASVATQLMNGVADSLYNRGEGVRYAVEQTFGYTVPRFVQQQYRTFDITGEKNKQAGEEMFIRDTAADFTDTFLPGLLATYVVGKHLDKRHGGLIQHNIDADSLEVYRTIAEKSRHQQDFFNTLQKLVQSPQASTITQETSQERLLGQTSLQKAVDKLVKWETTTAQQTGGHFRHAFDSLLGKTQDPYTHEAQNLAAALRLPSLDIHLKHPHTGHPVETTLPNILHDLTRMARHEGHAWDSKLAHMAETTLKHQPWQGLGTLAAFSISLMIPHWIRQMMVKRYGPQADTNPATRAISEHYDKLAKSLGKNTPLSHPTPASTHPISNTSSGLLSKVPAMVVATPFMGATQPFAVSTQKTNASYASSQVPTFQTRFGQTPQASKEAPVQASNTPTPKTHVKWFPYIRESLKQGNLTPALVSAGFFGFLGAVAGRHFVTQKAGRLGLDFAKGMKEFLSFERTFPFTTLRQMEFTYGALCGIRLMESRNDADFRETLLRDNLLGFPTLTWGTQWLRQGLSRLANKQLMHTLVRDGLMTFEQSKQVGHQLLFKTADYSVRRDAQEITRPMMQHALRLSESQIKHLPDLVARVKHTQNRVTLTSAAISVALLAFLEPQLGIWVTNSLEKRRQREKLGVLTVEPPHFSSHLPSMTPSAPQRVTA